jgi:hypothetical protein
MKYRFTLLVLFCLSMTQFSNGQHFTDYRWKSRLIVIKTTSKKDSLASQQLNRFKNLSKEIIERKLILFQVTNDSMTRYDEFITEVTIQKQRGKRAYKIARFEVLLIGLDGGIKSRFKEPVNAQQIFSIIDAMPMRQSQVEGK